MSLPEFKYVVSSDYFYEDEEGREYAMESHGNTLAELVFNAEIWITKDRGETSHKSGGIADHDEILERACLNCFEREITLVALRYPEPCPHSDFHHILAPQDCRRCQKGAA